MKQFLLFAASFVVLTVPLTWLWLSGGEELYAKAITPIAREIYELIGVSGKGTLRRTRFINLVPYTTLILLTPRLSPRKRLVGLLTGWLLLISSHIGLNGYAMASGSRGQLPPVAALGSDALPFLIWFVFARDFVRETLRAVRVGAGQDAGSNPEADEPDEAGE